MGRGKVQGWFGLLTQSCTMAIGQSLSETCVLQGHSRHKVNGTQAQPSPRRPAYTAVIPLTAQPPASKHGAWQNTALVAVFLQGGHITTPLREARLRMCGRPHLEQRRSAPDQVQRRHPLVPQLDAPWPAHEEPMPLKSVSRQSTVHEILAELLTLAAVVPTAANPAHDVTEGHLAADHVYLTVVLVDDAPLNDSHRRTMRRAG